MRQEGQAHGQGGAGTGSLYHSRSEPTFSLGPYLFKMKMENGSLLNIKRPKSSKYWENFSPKKSQDEARKRSLVAMGCLCRNSAWPVTVSMPTVTLNLTRQISRRGTRGEANLKDEEHGSAWRSCVSGLKDGPGSPVSTALHHSNTSAEPSTIHPEGRRHK